MTTGAWSYVIVATCFGTVQVGAYILGRWHERWEQRDWRERFVDAAERAATEAHDENSRLITENARLRGLTRTASAELRSVAATIQTKWPGLAAELSDTQAEMSRALQIGDPQRLEDR